MYIMKKLFRLVATLLIAITLVFTVSPAANAASQKTLNGITSSYSKYVTCKLISKNRPGTVNITVANYSLVYGKTQRNSVCMRTTSGALIWQETGAIACSGSRNFYLGNDHSAYRIYVKTYYGKAGVTFSNRGNVNIV